MICGFSEGNRKGISSIIKKKLKQHANQQKHRTMQNSTNKFKVYGRKESATT